MPLRKTFGGYRHDEYVERVVEELCTRDGYKVVSWTPGVGGGSHTYFIYLAGLGETGLRAAVVVARKCADTRQRASLTAQPRNDSLCPPSHHHAPVPRLVSLSAGSLAPRERTVSGFVLETEFLVFSFNPKASRIREMLKLSGIHFCMEAGRLISLLSTRSGLGSIYLA